MYTILTSKSQHRVMAMCINKYLRINWMQFYWHFGGNGSTWFGICVYVLYTNVNFRCRLSFTVGIRLAFLSQHQWRWRMLLYTITITSINHLRYIRTSQHCHRWWYRWKCYLRFPMRNRNPCTLIGIHFGIPTYFNLICASLRAIILRKQFQESVSFIGPVFSSFYLFSFDTLKLIYTLQVERMNCGNANSFIFTPIESRLQGAGKPINILVFDVFAKDGPPESPWTWTRIRCIQSPRAIHRTIYSRSVFQFNEK